MSKIIYTEDTLNYILNTIPDGDKIVQDIMAKGEAKNRGTIEKPLNYLVIED